MQWPRIATRLAIIRCRVTIIASISRRHGGERRNNGVPGLVCAACHSDRNIMLSIGEARYQSIPGHPRWALAPLEMAWEGKCWVQSAARSRIRHAMEVGASRLHEHIAKDDLVMGLAPGAGRTPAPGTQEQLGALIQAWIDTGAECP
jgi:hypothetical protein